MIRLRNIGSEQISYTITRTPFSASQKSPNPGEVINPENPTEKIKNPSLTVPADNIVIRANETVGFDGDASKSYNQEQGEYLYATLGVPEFGGTTLSGKPILNKNFLIEVDAEDVEVQDNLFRKYREQNNVEIAQKILRVESQ